MAFEKSRRITERLAAALHRRRQRCRLGRCFNAWRRAAREARAAKAGPEKVEKKGDGQAAGDSDGIDIDYTVREEEETAASKPSAMQYSQSFLSSSLVLYILLR